VTSPEDPTDQIRRLAKELAPMLLDELRGRARYERRRVRAGHTLQTTALVHEAYLRLNRQPAWQDESHFMRAAAMAMRQILVDHARYKLAAKRGGGTVQSLEDLPFEPFWQEDEQLLALDEALTRLSTLNPRLTHIIECRFFAGYSDEETARTLEISERTVRRDWIKAKAWLFRELALPPAGDSAP